MRGAEGIPRPLVYPEKPMNRVFAFPGDRHYIEKVIAELQTPDAHRVITDIQESPAWRHFVHLVAQGGDDRDPEKTVEIIKAATQRLQAFEVALHAAEVILDEVGKAVDAAMKAREAKESEAADASG